MKKIIKYILLVIIILINGCNSGTDTIIEEPTKRYTDVDDNTSKIIVMDINKEYIIDKGYKIIAKSNLPLLKMNNNLKTGKTIIILKKGKAEIHKK